MDTDNRRQLNLDPREVYLHIRYHAENWLGQKPVARDELVECKSIERANQLAEVAKNGTVKLMFVETLRPGEMPQLHRTDAWYLHAHILVHDGTILLRNIPHELLDPHSDEAEAQAALRRLQAYMIGQGGLMKYCAIVPPTDYGPSIVIKPRD